MFMNNSVLSVVMLALVVSFSGCQQSEEQPEVIAQTINNLNADYAPLVFNHGGPPTRPAETKKYTLFNFRAGQIIPNADSASGSWDIGFRATSIIFNSGTSGPGTTAAQVVIGTFDEIREAPEGGYIQDNKTLGASGFAVLSSPLPAGSTVINHWWQNTGSTTSTIVSPIAGRVIVVRTGDGKYVKMEILSYYENAPASPNNLVDKDRFYTFRYVYQPGESRSFE
jgi:hypothetical protein